MAVFKEKAAIVINGIVYVAEPMDDCEYCAFCTGLAQCSVDFICISMREAFRKGISMTAATSLSQRSRNPEDRVSTMMRFTEWQFTIIMKKKFHSLRFRIAPL